MTTKPSDLSKSEIEDAAKALGASYLNPLDPDQKDVALALGAAYGLGKVYDGSGKVASEFRARMRKSSNEDFDVDLEEPDEVASDDPRKKYNFSQEDTSSKPENTEQKQGGDKFMSADGEDDDYGVPEGVNEDIYEALGDLEDALYQDAQQRGMAVEEVEEVLEDHFYDEVVPAVEDISAERDDYEEELVSKIGDFEDYVRHNIESREELVEEVSGFGDELVEYAEEITLHGAVPEERAQRTSELVDEITGRDEDEEAETDGGWFGLR